jgi:hypothetical protein
MERRVNCAVAAVDVGQIQSVDRSSYKEISDRADRARAVFQTRGAKLHRDGSLGKILRVANELSKSWENGKRLGGIHEVLGPCRQTASLKHIVATTKDFTVPIACKKVDSEKGVEAQVRKGVKQVEANGAGGLVALNVDDLLPGDAVLKQRDHVSASAWLGVFVGQFIERNRFTFQRYVTQGRCDGILISATCVCDLEERSSISTFNAHGIDRGIAQLAL